MNKLTLLKFIDDIQLILDNAGYDTLFVSKDVHIHGAHLRQVSNNEVIDEVGRRGKYKTYILPSRYKPKIERVLAEMSNT